MRFIAACCCAAKSTRTCHAVVGDPSQLKQVLVILIVNAMDAMKDTPEAQREVTVGVRRAHETFVELEVRDRGHGIAPASMSAAVRVVFHHQARRHGHGFVDRALHGRGARRAHLGRERCRGAAPRFVSRWPSRRFQPPPDRPRPCRVCGSKVRCPLPVHCRRNSIFTREIAMKLTHALAGGLCIAIAAQATGSNYCSAGADARGLHEDDAYFRPKGRTPRCRARTRPSATPGPSSSPVTIRRIHRRRRRAEGGSLRRPAYRRARARRGARRRRRRGGRRNREQRCGQGSATGAAVGVVAGGSRNRQAKREQEAQVNAANSAGAGGGRSDNAANAQALADFKKGMGACLEGKGYVVK